MKCKMCLVTLCMGVLFVGCGTVTEANQISGIVRDENGPISGAIVRIKTTDVETMTDSEGCFMLTDLAPDQSVLLTAWSPGFYIGGGTEFQPGAWDVEIVLTKHAEILMELWTEITPSGAYWNPTRVVSDNRIPAFGSDKSTYIFDTQAESMVRIDVSLFFRRAFIELMDQKNWNISDILMEHNTIIVGD